jgi:murein DD-endopeptidase MepM/ murein hydrolase activator NlpD
LKRIQANRCALILAFCLTGCADVAPTMPQDNPVPGSRLSSDFGARENDPINGFTPGAHHDGYDLAAKEDSPIHPSRDGKVIFKGFLGGYGNAVIIEHKDGFTTLYGHAKKIMARVGDLVTTKSVIATVGSTGRSTGPHLHYELRKNNVAIDPVGFTPSPQGARLPVPPRLPVSSPLLKKVAFSAKAKTIKITKISKISKNRPLFPLRPMKQVQTKKETKLP